jgi:hypothetical protein
MKHGYLLCNLIRFVCILKTKCPNHAEMFLEMLQLSLREDDYHLGHKYLSSKLEDAILERKRVRSLEERQATKNIPIPAHLPARPNDSGLGLAVVSAGSSQDTGSLRSTISGASIGSYPADQLSRRMRRLRIPGLQNLEDGSACCQAFDEKQISSVKRKVIHDTRNITRTFAVMVLGVYRLLKQSNTPVDEVRIMLQFLGCKTSNKTGSESITMFSGSDEISESKDLTQLVECLRKYSSWYNYHLMKEVAEQFAGDEGKKLISDYEADLRNHFISLIAYQCPGFVLEQRVPPGYTQLIVKVDWDYMSTNLQDIATFQTNLADILELEPYVFQLRSVEEGCVRLEWGLPASLESHVTDMMAEREECLKKLKILRIEVVSASSPSTAAKIFVGQPPSHKAIGSLLGCVSLPHVPCQPSLSSSSSIISILEQPMSSIEAELLSLYDSSGSSRGGSMHEEGSLLPLFNYAESVPQEEYIGESDGWEDSDCGKGVAGANTSFRSDADVEYTDYEESTRNYSTFGVGQTPTLTSTHPHICTPVRRACCSEGNLHSPLHPHSNLEITKKEGASLPDIAEGGSSVPRSNIQRRSPSGFVHSLTKLRKSILGRLLHPDRKTKKVEYEDTMYCRSPTLRPLPFSLVDFTEEPRKIGSSRDIHRCTGQEMLKSQSLSNRTFSQCDVDRESLVSVKGAFIDVPPFLDVRRDSAISAGSLSPPTSPTGLQLPVATQRRDSAVPSSPSSSISFRDALSPVVPRLKHDQDAVDRPRVDRDSDNGSYRSESSQQAAGLYHRQTSFDSVDTASLASVSTQPSSKRNSYSSHYYVNINPIMEDPDDHHAAENHWKPQDHVSFPKYPPRVTEETYSQDECEKQRERSHSLNEAYARSVHGGTRLQSSSTASPQSSGYVSYAGSMYQVDSDTMHSKESLADVACGAPSPSPRPLRCHAPNSAPFPSASVYHRNANIRRGGSLKGSVKFATCVTKPPLLRPRDASRSTADDSTI